MCVQGGVGVVAVVSDSNTDPASNCATIRKKLRYMVPISVQFTDTSHLSVSNFKKNHYGCWTLCGGK